MPGTGPEDTLRPGTGVQTKPAIKRDGVSQVTTEYVGAELTAGALKTGCGTVGHMAPLRKVG